MTGFLQALKADLLDRRMRLPVAVALIALVAGIAYAATAGSGGAGSQQAVPPVGTTAAVPAPAHNALESSESAQQETTYAQAGGEGQANDFFAVPTAPPSSLSAPSPKVGGPANTAASQSGSGTATHPSSGGGSGTTTPTAPSHEKPKPKPTPYAELRAGKVPLAPAAKPVQLRKGGTLTVDNQRLVAASSVSPAGKGTKGSVKLRFIGAAPILAGQATCQPSAVQCEAIVLAEGQEVELSYLQPNGETVTYAITLVAVKQRSS